MPPSRRPRAAASPSPAQFSSSKGHREGLRDEQDPDRRCGHRETRSRARRERTVVSASGPRNSIVTATPIGSRAERGVEATVHQPEGESEGDHGEPGPSGVSAQPRPCDEPEDRVRRAVGG